MRSPRGFLFLGLLALAGCARGPRATLADFRAYLDWAPPPQLDATQVRRHVAAIFARPSRALASVTSVAESDDPEQAITALLALCVYAERQQAAGSDEALDTSRFLARAEALQSRDLAENWRCWLDIATREFRRLAPPQDVE